MSFSVVPRGGSWGGGRVLELWRLALVVVFAYGAMIHLLQLAGSGGNPYPGMPVWLVVCFVSLTLVDPAVAVGLGKRWRGSAWAALAVLVVDAAANGYANYVVIREPGITWGRVGQGAITLLTLVTAFTARRLGRASARNQR